MADISLKMSGLSVTCVSNAFIDHYMADATGEYVKIYIYLLRCLEQEGETFSVQKIAAKLGHTDLDVKRAFDYWEKLGMIRQDRDAYGELTGICVIDPFTSGYGTAVPQQPPIEEPVFDALHLEDEGDSHDISYYEDDEAFSELLFLAETYTGHPLSPKDIDRILFWYDGLSMPADLVEYLITYCADKGHSSLAYMNKIALSWADNGITTVEQAKAETTRHSEIYYAVCTAFGITGRNLAPAELSYIHRWETMFTDTDIIREACSRTILRTGKGAFSYADRVLDDWHRHGVRTMADIARYDQSFATKKSSRPVAGHHLTKKDSFHNFTGREYEDWDELEAKLLAKK